jgi:hypothetical protein
MQAGVQVTKDTSANAGFYTGHYYITLEIQFLGAKIRSHILNLLRRIADCLI